MKQRGLTEVEARERRKQFGPNLTNQAKKIRPVFLLLEKFRSPLSLVLIAASVLSYFLGERSNAIIILLMVSISAVIDFVNTYHSEKAVEELEAKVAITVRVWRDGQEQRLTHDQLVPGDVVALEAGDVVPADLHIMEANSLYLNQSALTGESFPVAKSAELTAAQAPSADNPATLLMGSSVLTGSAVAEVVATGARTQFGQIATRLQHQKPETDFERGIKNFSYFVMRITLLMVIVVFFSNTFFGRDVLDSFLFAIAIAIGLTPELLPVILSVSLSRGSVALSKKSVIVKKLIAIQNLGGMDVLCTDKTGTLTEDRIVLVEWTNPTGQSSLSVLENAYIASSFHTGVDNPLDQAVRVAKQFDLSSVKKLAELPFDYQRKRSSVVVEKEKQIELIMRGSPETVFAACKQVSLNRSEVAFTTERRAQAEAVFQRFSRDGYRVLAVAKKELSSSRHWSTSDEKEMTFLGFVSFLDPPKEGAEVAIRRLERLGVAVKVITGDHEILAEKICRDVGIPVTQIVTGEQIQKLSDQELAIETRRTAIFARISPEQKERIVQALKRDGRVVGFLGDGINDAPALKTSDVSISVNNAVGVAKEAADIILLKKSLSVIADGVIEGRKTFRNTLKYIFMGLSSNFGNVFSMSVASFFLPFLPMLPPQVLLNNFLYDMSQLSLSTDNVDESELSRPTTWNFQLVRRYMVVFGLVSSGFDFITFFMLLFVLKLGATGFQTAWFIESLTTQAVVVFFIRTKKIPFIQSSPGLLVLFNVTIVVLIGWLLPFSHFGSYFHFARLSWSVLGLIGGITAFYLLSIELTKRIFYRFSQSLT